MRHLETVNIFSKFAWFETNHYPCSWMNTWETLCQTLSWAVKSRCRSRFTWLNFFDGCGVKLPFLWNSRHCFISCYCKDPVIFVIFYHLTGWILLGRHPANRDYAQTHTPNYGLIVRNDSPPLLPRKLTVIPWKSMVGRWFVSFLKCSLFGGNICSFSVGLLSLNKAF